MAEDADRGVILQAGYLEDIAAKPPLPRVLGMTELSTTERYARSIDASKRVRWDIDRDVIRGRHFDFNKKFLPDGLSGAAELGFLNKDEKRLFSQIQGRTYANMFGLVERFINAKILEISREHWLGDQKALEALVRFSDEEIKHQELFRRIEAMVASGMPAGYRFVPEPNKVAAAVLSKGTWAVLALTCHIEIFVLAHYRASIDKDTGSSELWKDVFLYHWKEEAQHATIDELEWAREDARLSVEERAQGVSDLIELIAALDGLLELQAAADAEYFVAICGRELDSTLAEHLRAAMLKAYRWQYIASGVQEERFQKILGGMIGKAQMGRISAALRPIFG